MNRSSNGSAYGAPGLVLFAGVAATLTTVFGTRIGPELKPVGAQFTVAVLTAGLAIAVVPVALLGRGRWWRRPTSSYADLFAINLGLLSAGAASIHFVVISEHFKEWWGLGAFFATVGMAQLGWALLAVIVPSRRLIALGAIGNLIIVVIWAASRTSGLPFGPTPWQAEPIGFADLVATSLEAAIVLGAISLIVRFEAFDSRRSKSAAAAWLVGGATVVVTALSLLSAVGAAHGLIPS